MDCFNCLSLWVAAPAGPAGHAEAGGTAAVVVGAVGRCLSAGAHRVRSGDHPSSEQEMEGERTMACCGQRRQLFKSPPSPIGTPTWSAAARRTAPVNGARRRPLRPLRAREP